MVIGAVLVQALVLVTITGASAAASTTFFYRNENSERNTVDAVTYPWLNNACVLAKIEARTSSLTEDCCFGVQFQKID